MMRAGERRPLSLADLQNRVVITVPEYAATFCADERTVRRAIRDGQIQALQIGDTWRIPVTPLLRQCGLADAEPAESDLDNGDAAVTTPRHPPDFRPL